MRYAKTYGMLLLGHLYRQRFLGYFSSLDLPLYLFAVHVLHDWNIAFAFLISPLFTIVLSLVGKLAVCDYDCPGGGCIHISLGIHIR